MNKEQTQAGVSKPRYSEDEKRQVMSDLYAMFGHDDELFIRFLCLKFQSMTEERARQILMSVWIHDIEKDLGSKGIFNVAIMVIEHIPDGNDKTATTAAIRPDSDDKTPVMGEEGGGDEHQ